MSHLLCQRYATQKAQKTAKRGRLWAPNLEKEAQECTDCQENAYSIRRF